MKRALLLPVLLLLAQFAQAAVIPVSEDTYTAANSKIARGYGKFKTLTLAPGAAVLMRFDVNDFAGLIAADKVSSARVIVNITKVRKTGGLRFHRVTSEWTESANGVREAPSFIPTPFATFPADTVKTNQFAMVDLTAEVKQWLAAPETDFGIAITGDAGTALDFASKEGPTEGEPAWLEIESLQVTRDAQIAPGVDAVKLGGGSVDNTEFSYLNGVSGPIQSQLDAASAAANAANEAASAAATAADAANEAASAAATTGDAANAAASAAATTANAAVALVDATAIQSIRKDFSEPPLRVVRGTITWKNGAVTIADGSGFTVTNPSTEVFAITFNQAFASVPTVVSSFQVPLVEANTQLALGVIGTTRTSTTFRSQIQGEGRSIHFIAIGPR
ncbi:DNRLRE domain-containing protein [Haloferula sp. BvORR071]|uniref:DNRLRE domain-containing protein n=1 Tax=Haloferula sp. BvORR071 TaxID=1396141 RepID=UPI00054D95DA|nr:DNRLRE domain-containing protein [Haloferula sp. BvORR071]